MYFCTGTQLILIELVGFALNALKERNHKPYGPCGLMDKASDFESEDCEFESRRGHIFAKVYNCKICKLIKLY